MTADSASINLTHHFLIAMPSLEDASFAKSVVYVCEHSERGALGLVINKPSDLSMTGLFEKVELPLHRQDLVSAPVLQGGPVHTERGFVLHDAMVLDVPEQEAEALSAVSSRNVAATVAAMTRHRRTPYTTTRGRITRLMNEGTPVLCSPLNSFSEAMRIKPLGAWILAITSSQASMHRPQAMQAACSPLRMSIPVGQTCTHSVQSMQ